MDAFTGANLVADPQHWNHPWWPVFPILWLVVIVAVALLVSRRWRGCRIDARSAGEAKLAERFAAGEIDEGEYRSRLAVLRDRRRGAR